MNDIPYYPQCWSHRQGRENISAVQGLDHRSHHGLFLFCKNQNDQSISNFIEKGSEVRRSSVCGGFLVIHVFIWGTKDHMNNKRIYSHAYTS